MSAVQQPSKSGSWLRPRRGAVADSVWPDMEPERTQRFEKFARMRLRGLSDVEYRAFDLLSNRLSRRVLLLTCIKYAGLNYRKGQTNEALSELQRWFLKWGFGVVTFKQIEIILREFYVYHRVKYRGYSWPYRQPDETARLLREHEDAFNVL